LRNILGGLAAVLLLFALALPVLAAPSANAGQCDGATTIGNTPTSDGTIVLPAGLSVCIHAGNGNTGIFETDGTSTLADYILASGLLNDGGQVPGVSNYVVYDPEATPSQSPTPSSTPIASATPTPVPTPTVEPSPSVEPSSTPTFTPTPTPSESPTSTPEPSTPTVSPSPTVVPTPSSMPLPTPPATDTEDVTPTGTTAPSLLILLPLALGAFVLGYALTARKVR